MFKTLAKPLQSGRTQLVSVPEMPGVFCKYINLQSENFLSFQSSSLKVLLSVSWDQNKFINPNDASATWSENVSKDGFKACVLVAGRHVNSDFKQTPSVHWIVFQREMFNTVKNIYVGSTTLDTWYTGTQCKIVHTTFGNFANVTVYASIENPERSYYQNAMTVWSEITSRYYDYYTKDIRVCARELQNFDGIHKDIIVVSNQKEFIFYLEISRGDSSILKYSENLFFHSIG